MTAGRKQLLSGLLMVWVLVFRLFAQNLNWDNSVNSLVFRPVLSKTPGGLSLNNELDYSISVSGFYFMNGPGDKTSDQLGFLHSLKYTFRISSKRFQLTNDLIHNLGLIYYIDSISKFQTDESSLTTKFSYEAAKFLQFTASSILTTRIFNAWDISQGAGGSVIKTINSSFLTPLICTFSGGFGFNIKKNGTLEIGISSVKLTYVRDPGIFDKTGRDSFYGVKKGKSSFLEYGLSMHLLIDKRIGKKIQWNCDLLLFKANQSAIDLTFKNLFAYRINRFLKTSLQTRLFYDEDVSRQLRMENLLSVGFDFHL
ncbi:MAG: hypothetical protein NTX43_10860 [Bacteroidetes bacterium]|nr:hypothetical protein [Bacteroidota bacterium]